MSRQKSGFKDCRRLAGSGRWFAVVGLCLALPACGIVGGDSRTTTVSGRNALVQELMDMEQALAAERNRADTADQAAQRAKEEANWILQTAQAGPDLLARNEELAAEISELQRANAVLLQDSAALASLRDRVMELETENRELIEASASLQAVTPSGESARGNNDAAVAPDIDVVASRLDPPIDRQVDSGPSGDEPNPAIDGGVGAYGLHLASYRSPGQVASGWQHFQALYPEWLGGLSAISVVLDVPGIGGTYHRLIAGPVADRSAADGMCEALRARQEYCVVAEYDAGAEQVE